MIKHSKYRKSSLCTNTRVNTSMCSKFANKSPDIPEIVPIGIRPWPFRASMQDYRSPIFRSTMSEIRFNLYKLFLV